MLQSQEIALPDPVIIKLKTILSYFIVIVDRVFANCPEDLGSIPGRVTPKTLKMVLDTSLFNTI